jgi:type I restriction enzyme S subunit
MKAGWEVKTLGDVCEVVNGGTPKTGVDEYWGNEHLWITPAEMGKRLSPYVDETERKITSQGLKNSSARLLPHKSVILSSRAPIGHLVINTKPMATNQGCKGLVPNVELGYKYLFYFLMANVDLLNELGTGATFKELSGGKLKEVKIPLAPVSEQQRIVAKLDQAFEGIAKARANAEQNLQNARALFESHLQSVFNQRGEGWVEKSIGDIAKIKGGKRVPKGYKLLSEQTNHPYLRVTDFNDTGSIDMRDLRYIDDGIFKEIKNYIIHDTDLYISIAGTIGKTGIIPKQLDGANLTENACRLVFNTDVLNKYVYYFTTTKDFIEQAGLNTRTAAQPKLALSRLSTIKLGLPNLENQKKLVKEFDALREETKRLEALYQRKIACLDELKKSLLQQAFAGEL